METSIQMYRIFLNITRHELNNFLEKNTFRKIEILIYIKECQVQSEGTFGWAAVFTLWFPSLSIPTGPPRQDWRIHCNNKASVTTPKENGDSWISSLPKINLWTTSMHQEAVRWWMEGLRRAARRLTRQRTVCWGPGGRPGGRGSQQPAVVEDMLGYVTSRLTVHTLCS